MVGYRGEDVTSTEIYLPKITAILRQVLGNTPCQVYLFGSRAGGQATPVSDFDVAVWSESDLGWILSLARERLAESNIPLKIDLVDLRATSPEFAEKVRLKGLLLWQN